MTASKYQRVEGKKFEGTGQALLVWNYLAEGPLLVKDIETKLAADPKFKTRQTALRIAAYYICVFKKAGLVAPVANTEETVEDEVLATQHD